MHAFIISAVDPPFLNTSEYQQFFEETDAVMECPAFFGDPQGVICTRDNATDDRLTLSIQNIQQNDSAIYRYDEQVFYVRVLGKSVQAINRMHVQVATIIVIIQFYSYP